ncbi:MAG: tyrosine-protein phosphatase [Acidobacteriota bacterium]
MFDLHNHMLPELDDGPRDWDQSLIMARIAVEDGIEGIVCTPHWVNGSWDNGRSTVMDAVELFREKLAENNIALDVYPGSELHLDFDLPRRIEEKEVLTINDTGRYALVELPTEVVPPNMRNFFWELQSQNVVPIVSHPERNHVLMRDPERLFNWVDMGVLTQVTASSLLGKFGSEIRRFTIQLMEHNMAHIIATDAHSPTMRTPRLSEAYSEAEQIVGEAMAREMVVDTPRLVIQGEPIRTYNPIPLNSRRSKPSFFKRLFGRDGR